MMEEVVLARRRGECCSVIQQLVLKEGAAVWRAAYNTVTYTFKTKEKACANLRKHKNVTASGLAGAWCWTGGPKGHSLSCYRVYAVQFSLSVGSDSLRPHGVQHTRLPGPSPTPGACSNSYPWSQWCHPTISSSVEFRLHPKGTGNHYRILSSRFLI